jgi:hypothetical protein
MGGLFKTKEVKIPEPPPVVAMADPNDKEIELSQRRDIMTKKRETGKQSTLLSDADAGDYNKTALGA